MSYTARKIYLTCDESVVHDWAAYMRAHLDEVVRSLRQEQVRHEMWFQGRDHHGLFLIGVMDVDDHAKSAAVAAASTLGVDLVHRQFRQHWDRARTQDLDIAPEASPVFANCTLLFEARG